MKKTGCIDKFIMPTLVEGNMVILRKAIERLVRNKIIKRRLPKNFSRLPIYVSPDSQLKYIKPNKYSAFDEELLYVVEKYIEHNFTIWDIGVNISIFSFSASHRIGKGESWL